MLFLGRVAPVCAILAHSILLQALLVILYIYIYILYYIYIIYIYIIKPW